MTPRAAEGAAPAETAATTGRGSGLGLAAALAVFAGLVAHGNFLIDDAFISFRYARNWAEGAGLVYQPGAGPPVEGYSNFLWVALLSACARLGLALEVASRALSIASGALLVLALHRFLARDLRLSAAATTLGTLSLAAFPPFATWCTGGLETATFTLLLFLAFRLLLSERGRSRAVSVSLAAVGIVLIRQDGAGWALVLLASAWLAARLRGEGQGAGATHLRTFGLASLCAFTLFLLWRYLRYDALVANTAHAKTVLDAATFERGWKTALSFALLFVTPFLAPFALLGRTLRPAAAAALCVLLCFAAYNVVVGGDWMPMFRFLAPASPFLAVLLAILVERLGSRRGSAFGTVAIGVALLPAFGVSVVPAAVLEPIYFREFRVGYETERERWASSVRNLENFTTIGRGLAQVARPGDSITCGAIGAIGYYSGLRILDRNGLVDPEVARLPAGTGTRTAGHDKRVPRAWFRSRRPTFFEALLVDAHIEEPSSPGFDQAARTLAQTVFRDPAETPLFECSLPVVFALRAEPGIPEGHSLIVLRATDDREAARAAWQRIGFE